MKIVTPLTSEDYYESLVKAGADEFYCGFIPGEWLESYSNVHPLNRREFLKNANICSYSSMEILQKMKEKYQVPVKITFNSLYYLPEQYEKIKTIIINLMNIGFCTYIIADTGLIMYLRKHNVDCEIHLSGENGQLNHLGIEFFNQYHISRYVFTRKDTLEDIENCIKKNPIKDTEYEAFVLNEYCPYSGAFCNTIHCDWMLQMCRINNKIKSINGNSPKLDRAIARAQQMKKEVVQRGVQNERNTSSWAKSGCGVCKIKRLGDIGVTHLKVVGRGKKLDLLTQDIVNVKKIIQLSNVIEESDFEENIRMEYFGGECKNFCYYPSIANCYEE